MQGALQVRYHGLESTEMLSQEIETRVAELERLFGHITDCTVALEQNHHRHAKGNVLRVSIDVRVPGKKIIVSRENALDSSHDDALIVLRDAFGATKRKLQDYARRMRGDVKVHKNPYQDGYVLRILVYDGYGFISADGEREIYFHENSVVKGSFDELRPGSHVRFVEEQGEKGPQASTVLTVKI